MGRLEHIIRYDQSASSSCRCRIELLAVHQRRTLETGAILFRLGGVCGRRWLAQGDAGTK